MQFDLTRLFTAYTKAFGSLNNSQKTGLTFLIGKIEADEEWPADLRQIAYFLATIKHETAHTFYPVKEGRERSNSPRRKNQDRYWLTGEYGRGYVQITWDRNYRKFGLLPAQRDKALEPETAYRIAAQGMRQGMFTGKKLSDFFTVKREDFITARKIINGLDRAQEIAVIARKMQACLALALVHELAVSTENGQTDVVDNAGIVVTVSSPEATSPSLVSTMFSQLRAGYAGATESEKSLVGRVTQVIWTVILGVIIFVQTHPIQIAVAVLVLLIGAYTIHSYIKRQDKKTFLRKIW